jgi:hypothetical protein
MSYCNVLDLEVLPSHVVEATWKQNSRGCQRRNRAPTWQSWQLCRYLISRFYHVNFSCRSTLRELLLFFIPKSEVTCACLIRPLSTFAHFCARNYPIISLRFKSAARALQAVQVTAPSVSHDLQATESLNGHTNKSSVSWPEIFLAKPENHSNIFS